MAELCVVIVVSGLAEQARAACPARSRSECRNVDRYTRVAERPVMLKNMPKPSRS